MPVLTGILQLRNSDPPWLRVSFKFGCTYVCLRICCSPTSDPAHLKMGQAQLPIGSWAGFCWPILRWATQLPMTQIIQQPSPTSDGNDFLLSVHLEVHSFVGIFVSWIRCEFHETNYLHFIVKSLLKHYWILLIMLKFEYKLITDSLLYFCKKD